MENEKIIKYSADVLKEVEDKIRKYLRIKESILDNDYVELAGDTVRFIGIVRKVSSFIVQKRFESFLEGFGNDQPTEAQLKKLADYINNEKKAEYISDSISKILISKSSKACLLMGIILGSIVKEDREIRYDLMICMQALPELFDFDVDNLAFLLEYLAEHKKLKALVSRCTTCAEYGSDFEQEVRRRGIEESALLFTIDKASNYHLLLGTGMGIQSTWADVGGHELSILSPGSLLLRYIKLAKLDRS